MAQPEDSTVISEGHLQSAKDLIQEIDSVNLRGDATKIGDSLANHLYWIIISDILLSEKLSNQSHQHMQMFDKHDLLNFLEVTCSLTDSSHTLRGSSLSIHPENEAHGRMETRLRSVYFECGRGRPYFGFSIWNTHENMDKFR